MSDENKDRLAVVALADVMSRLFTRSMAMPSTSPADSTPRLEGAAMSDPITVTLPDGRVLAFVDYDYMRGYPGSRLDPPESPEVGVREAWWVESDGSATPCTADELDALHNGGEYDDILLACEERQDAEDVAAWEDQPEDET
jgi:hypothetical protein